MTLDNKYNINVFYILIMIASLEDSTNSLVEGPIDKTSSIRGFKFWSREFPIIIVLNL